MMASAFIALFVMKLGATELPRHIVLESARNDAAFLGKKVLPIKLDVPPAIGTPIPVGRDISTVDQAEESALSQWLYHQAKEPADYLVSVIRKYPLIMIGETHQDRRLLTFIAANLGRFYHAGIRALALEVIKKESTEKTNRLVTSRSFDRALQLEIAREANWLNWNAQEQWEILEAVWRLNQTLPSGAEPLRIVGIEDGQIIFPYLTYLESGVAMDAREHEAAMKTAERAKVRDAYMTGEVSKIIDNGGHTLVLVGMNHAFTRYRQTSRDGRQNFRMGNMLFERFPDKVFNVVLHFAHESVEEEKPARMSYFLEKLLDTDRLPAAGFDVRGTPLEGLRDANSRYFRYATMYDFGDMADGYLYLGPLAGAPQCTRMKDFVLEETFRKWQRYFEIAVNDGNPLANVDQLNRKLLENTANP